MKNMLTKLAVAFAVMVAMPVVAADNAPKPATPSPKAQPASPKAQPAAKPASPAPAPEKPASPAPSSSAE